MTRLTLSQQVASLQTELAEKTAELTAANHLIQQWKVGAEVREADLANLRNQLRTADATKEELEKVKKELDSSKSSYTYANEARTKAENELEQCHAVLDGVDGAPSREYESTVGSYTSQKTRTVVTRLAGAFLSIAKNGGAK